MTNTVRTAATDRAGTTGGAPQTGAAAAHHHPPTDSDAATSPAGDRQVEYRTLTRKWWFGAAVGVPTMILSYPWFFPGLQDAFPRDSAALLVAVGGDGHRLAGRARLFGPPILQRGLGGAQAPLGQHAHPDRHRHRDRLDLPERRPSPSRWCSSRE